MQGFKLNFCKNHLLVTFNRKIVAITQTNKPKTHIKGSIFHVELRKVFGGPDDMIAKGSFVNIVCSLPYR